MSKATINCKKCGVEFLTYNKDALYCSIQCSNKTTFEEGIHSFKQAKPCIHCQELIRIANHSKHEAICLSYNKECKMCKKSFRTTKKNRRNIFCSQSCSATYNNSNKKSGIRRSKLELHLETRLGELYPKLNIEFNKIQDFGFELDILFPTLKLAFEINGIVHYQNIYGQEKYERTKNNDRNKMLKCYEKNITLVVLDTLEQKRFDEESSTKYLDLICKMVNHALIQKKKPSK